jgi:5-methyltetrahydropteroyltriglutamate--homocysteine methyltransferase
MLFPTSLVGSYPQPEWLIDRARLADRLPPRIRASDLRRVDPAHLEQAQLDATLLAIRAQERAGLDVVTDGEIRRKSYSNHFATALDGVDVERPGVVDLGDMTVETRRWSRNAPGAPGRTWTPTGSCSRPTAA